MYVCFLVNVNVSDTFLFFFSHSTFSYKQPLQLQTITETFSDLVYTSQKKVNADSYLEGSDWFDDFSDWFRTFFF